MEVLGHIREQMALVEGMTEAQARRMAARLQRAVREAGAVREAEATVTPITGLGGVLSLLARGEAR